MTPSSKCRLLYYKWKVKVSQSCPTLCDPMDYTVHRILQARILEWVTFPSPGDLPNLGSKPRSSALQADSLPSEPPGNTTGPWQCAGGCGWNGGTELAHLAKHLCSILVLDTQSSLKLPKYIRKIFPFYPASYCSLTLPTRIYCFHSRLLWGEGSIWER